MKWAGGKVKILHSNGFWWARNLYPLIHLVDPIYIFRKMESKRTINPITAHNGLYNTKPYPLFLLPPSPCPPVRAP
jgi:hypothetical protein